MSLNRRRNIFTLGDIQEKLNRRPESDPFEKDPFKVQSYNFHYAERPHAAFPVASRPSVSNAQDAKGGCQTYFYNYGFDSSNAVETRNFTNSANDECILNRNDCHEYRRKKFLLNAGPSPSRFRDQSKTLLTKPYESKILNVASKSSPSYTKLNSKLIMEPSNMQRSKTSYSLTNSQAMNYRRNNIQIKQPPALQPPSHSRIFKAFSSPLSDINVKSKQSESGCEININIKNSEKSLQDNVNIKIETDSYKNLNLNSGSSKINFQHKNNNKHNLQNFRSSETIVINKKHTKYYGIGQEDSEGFMRKTNSERIKKLNAIYGAQVLKKPPTKRNVASNERIPSRIPFGLNNTNNNNNSSKLYENNSKVVKNNLFRSKSLLEKSKINKSSITDCYATKSPYNNLSSSTAKGLNSLKQIPRDSLSFGTKNSEFKMTMPIPVRSSSKLPVNVNINVYADKLKLLQV